MEPQFISIGIAQAESGVPHYRWKEFVRVTGVKVYGIPGGGKVVDRAELNSAIQKSAWILDISEVEASK